MASRKTFDELTIEDNFMFSKVMLNRDIARHFLEIILGKKVREISYPVYERTIDIRSDAKSIRLDVMLEDDEHTVYNLEMQATKLEYLVKRTRYYQDLIDLDLLEKGADYDNMNHSLVIFICTFDPFGLGQYKYSFENMCKEVPSLSLGDGTEKIFINTKGYRGKIDEEFRQMLEYFNGRTASGVFVDDLKREVNRIRASEEWRREFMTLEIFLNDERKIARKLGQEEGMELGRAEGELFGLIQQVCKKLKKGKNVREIADDLEEDEDRIQTIISVAEQYSPDYDAATICQLLLNKE